MLLDSRCFLVMFDLRFSSFDHFGLLGLAHELLEAVEHLRGHLQTGVALGELVCLHHVVQPADHLVRMGGSMPYDRMQLVHESVVGDHAVNLVVLRVQVGVEQGRNLFDPAVVACVHRANVGADGLSEVSRMHVRAKDVQDLSEELLLVQIVKLQGGEHSVDDEVLVNKSRQLTQNS